MHHMLSVLLNDSSESVHTIKGFLGFVMAVMFPLFDSLNKVIQLLGAIGGLFLLFFAIRHKIIQYRIDKKKYKDMTNGHNNSGN